MASNLKGLYKKLGVLDKKEFSYLADIDYNINSNFSLRYKNALLEMQPEAIFCLENEPFILFFNLETSTEVENELNRIYKQSWNFDKAPIIVVSTSNEIVFYNAFNFDTKTCKLVALTDCEKDFEAFTYENLYTGNLFEIYKNQFVDTRRVNYLLLEHITDYRNMLIEENMDVSLANNIISRLIFLKYLQDRKISIDARNDKKIEESFANKQKLYQLFKYLKSNFNGDLFDINESEENAITNKYFDILTGFFDSIGIYGQRRLFPFDFSIIPIELISNIYEKFLTNKQGINTSYYTPTFLVDYIISDTVSSFLGEKDKKDSDCKVLDPACGSGIFLIEALRKIIQKEEQINKGQKLTPQRLKELVENNIFGIDKDGDAINIAIFSLYITLLDYQNPKSILTFNFPSLKGTNFFVSDFFNCQNQFNTKLGNLDFILSNPPYGSIKGDHLKWCKLNSIPVSDNQIAQSFLVRAKDFCSSKTNVSMIVTSKILYNLNAQNFRKYFLQHFQISKVFELSAVRKQIFAGAVTPVSILSYKYSDEGIIANNLQNKFKHISVKPNLFFKYFKTLLIEKNDEKTVKQEILYRNDWLWKVLLYGNILDFYFIKRLKKDFSTIKSLEDSDNLYSKQGVIINGGSSYNSKHLIGFPFLDTKDKSLKPFNIDFDKCKPFDRESVHRVRTPDVFKSPYVLLKRGVSQNLSLVAAYSDRDLVFTNSVNAIKFKTNDKDKLLNLTGLLNSNLYTYLNLLISSSITVEREEIYKYEFLNLPYIYDSKIKQLVEDLQNNYTESKLTQLENQINKSFYIDDIEKDLIDYALNISIPVWKFGDTLNYKKQPLAFKNVSNIQLENYINVFRENFAELYKYFNIDVYKFKYCTLVNFKTRQEQEANPVINFIENTSFNEAIKGVTDLSINKITNEIYIKKDIKGFEQNSFFVLKTNEYKNWHRAIARLDVNEFANAIWEAELDLVK